MNWNHVNDETPEEHVEILLFVKVKTNRNETPFYECFQIGHYNASMEEYVIDESEVHEYPTNYFEGSYKVTHWMELPEPPK